MKAKLRGVWRELLKSVGLCLLSDHNKAIKSATNVISIFSKKEDDLRKTIATLTRRIEVKEQQARAEDLRRAELMRSRFLEIKKTDAGKPMVVKVTESYISSCIDTADGHDDSYHIAFMHLDDDGAVYPVTAGLPLRSAMEGELDAFYSDNPTLAFTQQGALVANGKTVGVVEYTDH